MMIAAILFAISVVALGQFALYYWRAILAGVAAQPLSAQIRTAAGLAGAVGPADFSALLNLDEVTPGLKGDNGGLWAVRAYYRVVETFGRLVGLGLPLVAAWTEREMATCTRYVAVRVGQRLERNLACAAEIRSC